MNREHWLLLSAFLGAIGAQLVTLEQGWQDAVSPSWVGATILQLAVLLRSFYSDKAGRQDQ